MSSTGDLRSSLKLEGDSSSRLVRFRFPGLLHWRTSSPGNDEIRSGLTVVREDELPSHHGCQV